METIEESENLSGRDCVKSVRGEAGSEDYDDLERGSDVKSINQSCMAVPRRTAMGEYIVPKGGDPLTHQAYPTPGPADYLPSHQLTQPAFPQHSIVGRSRDFSLNKPPAGPADYNTAGDLIWSKKNVTLKGKGGTVIGERSDPTNTIGPAQYNVRYLNTGKHAPKISVSSRHRDGVNVGHPSNALSGINRSTREFPTPGPNAYAPKITNKGHHKSFGVLPRSGRTDQKKHLGPGPAAYNVTETRTKTGYTLAKRLKADWQMVANSPAPNSYNVGSKIGKGLAMSIRSRQPIEKKSTGPSPNSYFLRDAMKHSDAPAAAITYRPFERDDSIAKPPGPAHYTITDKTRRKAPRYSFRSICKYPNPLAEPEDTPGPGTYLSFRNFTENDSPAHTMGKRTEFMDQFRYQSGGPGPNHYDIRVLHRPDLKKAPSFTMAARCYRPEKRIDNPAPTAYSPNIVTNGGPKYSMTSRRAKMTKRSGPAPNSYDINNQTVKGCSKGPTATLKGRNTRFLYQGYAFQNSVRLRDA